MPECPSIGHPHPNIDTTHQNSGPHIPHTGRVKAYQTVKNSGTNWLGQTENDPLQRVYGISFPDKDSLKKVGRSITA